VRPRPPGANTLIPAFYEETAHHPPPETLALAVLRDAEVLIIAEAASRQTVRSALPVGQRAPAAEHPAGHVLLAGQRAPAPEDAAQLDEVRRQHVARSAQGDAVTLAVPICPDGQHPTAALVAGVPAFRWEQAKAQGLLPTLREIAARLSHRLGALTYLPYGAAQARQLGPGVAMADDELHAFLAGPWAARLACVRPDGAPHVVPVWHEWRDAAFWVMAWPGSQWAAFVTRRPTVALTIDEPWPPLRRVLVRGTAEPLAPEAVPDGIAGLYRRLSTRYLGAPAPFQGQGWQVFCIPPTDIVARRER
jgi:hypothetical protein